MTILAPKGAFLSLGPKLEFSLGVERGGQKNPAPGTGKFSDFSLALSAVCGETARLGSYAAPVFSRNPDAVRPG